MNKIKKIASRVIETLGKINNLSLPATILIASVVLGGFYYISESNKQVSIERQQQVELRAKFAEQQATIDHDSTIASQKADCVTEAELQAVALNKASCGRGDYCIKGESMYSVAQYNNVYDICLQRNGIK